MSLVSYWFGKVIVRFDKKEYLTKVGRIPEHNWDCFERGKKKFQVVSKWTLRQNYRGKKINGSGWLLWLLFEKVVVPCGPLLVSSTGDAGWSESMISGPDTLLIHRSQKGCCLLEIAGRWPRRLESAQECVITHLPKRVSPKMDDAKACAKKKKTSPDVDPTVSTVMGQHCEVKKTLVEKKQTAK